jgi:hypothetical protein
MQTLDILLNAHYLNRADKEIVGYLIDDHGRPIPQGAKDPFPGYYISQTAFTDIENQNERDPRRYVDARNINYVVRGDLARRRGVRVGDFVSVYSKRTRRGVFAIVGDTGNPTGDEGSLHLMQDLGYPFHDGKNDVQLKNLRSSSGSTQTPTQSIGSSSLRPNWTKQPRSLA